MPLTSQTCGLLENCLHLSPCLGRVLQLCCYISPAGSSWGWNHPGVPETVWIFHFLQLSSFQAQYLSTCPWWQSGRNCRQWRRDNNIVITRFCYFKSINRLYTNHHDAAFQWAYLRWTPRPLCFPEHSRQIQIPYVTLTHWGLKAPHSKQSWKKNRKWHYVQFVIKPINFTILIDTVYSAVFYEDIFKTMYL